MIIAHLDPFYAECRAYGRIGGNQRNGIVAVHCYGSTAVSAAQEGYLNETFNVSDWDRPSEEYDLPVAKRQSFRAIVKDLVQDTTAFKKNDVARMLKDLMSLRKMGVFVRDIKADNYRGDKLVDFSVSWTAPHLMLSDILFYEENIEEEIVWELMQASSSLLNTGGLLSISSVFLCVLRVFRAVPFPPIQEIETPFFCRLINRRQFYISGELQFYPFR